VVGPQLLPYARIAWELAETKYVFDGLIIIDQPSTLPLEQVIPVIIRQSLPHLLLEAIYEFSRRWRFSVAICDGHG
jgi:hypothetical protein